MAYDEDLADRIRGVVAAEPGLTERKMFGGLAFLLDGHMAVAASGREGSLMLRVDSEQTETLVAEPHAERFVMRGKELDGWLRIAPAGVARDADLERWTRFGVDYVRSLPPK